MTAGALLALGLKIVGASAGSGKTTRLTREIEEAITSQGPSGISPEGLVAVTYTRRAHVELESRIRRALLASKGVDRAAWLPMARIGTVHGVCLRWLRELALDAGVSPHVEVLTDSELALAQVLEETVPAAEREELDELADRLEMHKDTREAEVHWDQPVEDVIALARNGRIKPDALASMADRSADGLLALLPQPAVDGARLDAALAGAVDAALQQIDSTTDTTDKTRKAIYELRGFQRSARFGHPTWGEWLSLSKLDPGAKSRAAVASVNPAAAAHLSHPRFHNDLRRFTALVYRAAAVTLERYAEWKRQRGVVDYVDMVDHALDLMTDQAVADDLRQKLELVVVDELQDSSPIQLALFLRLHALAGRSTWVGDPKQCIFEYAGADPALMDAVIRWSKSAGGKPEQQGTNYRSRRGLVALCNAVFADPFVGHGMARADVVVAAHRSSEPELDSLPPLGLFYLESRNKEDDAACIAAGVARLLASPAATPVVDRRSGLVRPARPGDIAVLVLTNSEGNDVAAALAHFGLRATVARSGLMATPEGVITAAALRYLLDSEDSLAIAELEAMHGWGDTGPDGWLNGRLAGVMAPLPPRHDSWRAPLDALRDATRVLSPQELVEAVLVALDLATLAARWPDAPLRLANLDAVRKFARVYEQRCIDGGEGCSLAGLLRFLNDLTRVSYRHGDERRADEQYAGGDDGAVTVMTYHRSKGLEWPVVILGSLDSKPKPGTFEVSPESERPEIDPDDPLAGRWIRYWPWPFANRASPLEAIAESSAVGLAAAERERRERARLLYVGFTRARDHLVFAARLSTNGPKTGWLSELRHANAPALTLPGVDDPNPSVTVGAERVDARVWRLASSPPAQRVTGKARAWFTRASAGERPSYRIQPSAGLASGLAPAAPAIREIHVIHPPMVELTRGAERDRVGHAIHDFLATDAQGVPLALRVKRAARLLEGYGVQASYAPQGLLAASDAFRAFVAKKLPGTRWAHEVPIEAKLDTAGGERRVDGRIDLLLETDTELVVVDHKSFPGVGERAWRDKAIDLAPQLAAYQSALAIVRPGKPTSSWIHFVTAGAVVMFEPAALG